MSLLIRNLIRPYRWTLVLVLLAMFVETAIGLAAPWPLKVILDNVAGTHHLPGWVAHLLERVLGDASKPHIAVMAAVAFVAIAVIGALAYYVDNYYTESVGQWVAHDLRMQTYHHLQRLSLQYYDSHQVGTL
ncbi:MAG: ABC transporter ATP-binding protein, partial [Acidobacteriaceae bacterium]|nr:ABC transporter ATP-binding protein [Acidobacteriaceae bacterium]